MNLRPHDLAAHLKKGLSPLYVLHGNEPLLLAETGDLIRRAARDQGISEREVLVNGPGFKWEHFQLATGNISLFGDAKLVDLRIPNGKPGKEGGDVLQQLAAHPGDGTFVLISLPELDWQTRKSAWFSALEKHGICIQCDAPPLEQLPDWLAGRLAQQQQSASSETLRFIAECVEGNLLAAHQEIQKLGLLYPAGELSLEQVRAALLNVARYGINDIREALLQADHPRIVRLLKGLEGEGEAPPLVLWMIANEVRTLALLRKGMDRGETLGQLFKQERIFDERRKQLMTAALKKLSTAWLEKSLLHAAHIDRLMKGLEPGDFWQECIRLLLTLSELIKPPQH